MKGIRQVSTRGMSREDWLALRRKSIGGSDAAGVVGLSPWSSPYALWADKTGKLPDKPDNEAMRIGRDLEDYVARRWTEETGKKVRRVQAMLYNPVYPFAHADIDRWVVGEQAGLECKTTSSLDLRQFKGVEFPERYYAQCVHYMAVTGAARWYLGVLVLGRGFFSFTLERDQEEIDALMAAEMDFWTLVEEDRPPAADGLPATGEALRVVYEGGQEAVVDLFGREQALREYQMLLKQRQALTDRIQEIRQTLMLDLGDREKGVCGDFIVTWRAQKRAFLSRQKLREVYPRLDLSKAMCVAKFRRFHIQEEYHATD